MVFRDWLEARLVEHGWNPAEAAREMNMNPSLLSRYLNGRLNPSRQTMRRIAGFFGVPFTDVLAMVEEQEKAAEPRVALGRGFEPLLWERLSETARERILESARLHIEEEYGR